ncbi:MAG: hypothetical protein HY453_01070 [Parcubacteria group bacterium]|nr:hypothetical protein [Parcubacteria group bacterium]
MNRWRRFWSGEYVFLIVCFIFFGAANIAISLRDGSFPQVLWFCSMNVFLFVVALMLKNDFLIGSVFVGQFVFQAVWTTDMVSFFLTGNPILQVENYLKFSDGMRLFVTMYHFLLLIVPLWVLIKKKNIHRLSWMGASVFLLLVSLASLPFGMSENINCVYLPCPLGVFERLGIYYESFPLPYYLIHWISHTILFFIPTNMIAFFAFEIVLGNRHRDDMMKLNTVRNEI